MLSYIITTKNKLPYLKITVGRLIFNKKSGDEILVADAGSTDGSREFLQNLLKEGKINYLVSEPDFGESHALNKLFMKVKGELITIITDDDAFHYPAIEACQNFMIQHPEIDILGTDGGKKDQNPDKPVGKLSYVLDYKEWQKTHKPFMCCGLGLMMRRDSMTLLGFWDPNFTRADAEFMFRVTAGKANIAWYSNPSFVNISNPLSVSVTKMKKVYIETQRLQQFYLGRKFVYPFWFVELRSKISKLLYGEKKNTVVASLTITDWEKILIKTEEWLAKENSKPGEFLFNAA